jgi:hypothetical protein
MAYKNPEDARRYRKRWYKRNKAKHIANARKNTDAHRSIVQKALVAYLKEHPCVDCGETDIVVLDFDHVRGKKLADVSDMKNRGYKLETIMREIEKCDVVCANDHRRRTAKRGLHFKHVAQMVTTTETGFEMKGPLVITTPPIANHGIATSFELDGTPRVQKIVPKTLP